MLFKMLFIIVKCFQRFILSTKDQERLLELGLLFFTALLLFLLSMLRLRLRLSLSFFKLELLLTLLFFWCLFGELLLECEDDFLRFCLFGGDPERETLFFWGFRAGEWERD